MWKHGAPNLDGVAKNIASPSGLELRIPAAYGTWWCQMVHGLQGFGFSVQCPKHKYGVKERKKVPANSRSPDANPVGFGAENYTNLHRAYGMVTHPGSIWTLGVGKGGVLRCLHYLGHRRIHAHRCPKHRGEMRRKTLLYYSSFLYCFHYPHITSPIYRYISPL